MSSQITLVGKVLSQAEGSAKLTLKLQDDTGIIDVALWLNDEQDQQVRACMQGARGRS